MKKTMLIVYVMMIAGMAAGSVICSCDSAPVVIDTRTEPIVDVVNISWNAAWIGSDANGTVVITDNGEEMLRETGTGEFLHALSGVGRHELTYTTYVDGIAQEEVCAVAVFKDWKYEVADGGVAVVEASQKSGDVVIPEEIDGCVVTSIGASAFSGCSGLTSVTIPDSVTSIGSDAFYNCSGLASVTIPGSVTNIGSSAFSGCSGLTSVTIPDGVTSIGSSAFYGCSGLTSVTIPDGVTSIEVESFHGCRGLESVTIGNGVTTIKDGAFVDCTNLTEIVLYGDAPSVNSTAFVNISSSCNVKVPFGSTGWGVDIPGSWNGFPIDYTVPAVKLNANGGVLAETERVTDDGVIGELPVPTRDGYSFAGWFTAASDGEKIETGMVLNASVRVWAHWVANVYKVSFDTNVGAIEEGESSLEVVYDSPYGQLPTPMRSGYSFSGWLLDGSKVTSQTIVKTSSDHTLVASWAPNRYTVSYDANGGSVSGASSKSVTFYSTYGSLPAPTRTGYTFAGWTLNDEPITTDAVVSTAENHTIVAQWTINQYNVTFDADGGVGGCELVQDYGTEIVPPTVTRDGCTFEGWVPSVAATVPASNVTYKAKWKFWSVTIDSTAQSMRVLYPNDYANITSIVLSVGLTSIPSSFFSGCRNLTHVDIPSSVVSIGNSAFSGCSSLQCIVIPDSVTSIGSGAFYGCSGLKSMTLPFIGARRGNSGSSNSLFGYIFGTSSYSDGVQTKQYYSSGSYSTYYVPASLRSVVIMDETVLGYGAFYGCSGLTRVTIPDSVTSIGQYAFYGCSGLTSATIPDSVTNIADYAFAGCTNLQTEVWGGYRVLDGWLIGYTDEAEETIPDADKLKGICSEALKGCTALKRLEFGDRARLVSIGAEALKGCTELKTLVLPPSLTRIGDEAFMGCSYLDNVIVPGGVKSIGNRAFKNCTGFTWAQIEHGVESIGQEAFYGCWRITEVDIPSSVSSIGANAFGGDSTITKIALRGDSRKVSEIFSTYAQITEATVKPGTGALVDGLFSGCRSLETVRFIGNCPALANDGQKLYENTPSGSWNGLVTYIDKDSTGWDGTPGSHSLPMMWPLYGSYRREIRYAENISTPYAVEFDANGGTPKTQSEEQISESLFVLPNEPTRAGYVFMGWWTEKNGGVKVTDETVFLTGVYETLYAHWLSERVVQAQVLEKVFSGVVTVELGEDGNIIVTLTNDVSGTVEIPDNVGTVTIDLNGHDMVGDGGHGVTALPGGPAIRIVKGDGEGATTRLAIVDTAEGEEGQILGGGESAGIEVAEDAATGVKLDVEEGVGVFNGDGSEQPWWGLCPIEATLVAGEYFKVTLSELGFDVPTDGTPYSVVAKGLPAGLKLVSNAAVKDKKGKVAIKAKSEWWIEGVPTAAVDFFTNPPYLVITVDGVAGVHALPIEVVAQDVTMLEDLALGQTVNEQYYLPGVISGWAVSGLPTGLKFTAKMLTTSKKVGKKTVVTTNALPYSVYGKTTKAGLFTITAKKKVGAYYETMKYRVLVRPKAVDATVFSEELTNITTMAYVPFEWDLTNDVAAVGGKVAKVAGLPAGLAFASATTYKDKKKTQVKQYGQTIVGTPTKPGTYVVTFTKNVKSGKTTVAKTAQILWTVVENDAELELAFNTAGGVIEGGTVGLKYGDLLAFSATDGATVTASGMPAGITLANLGDGSYAFRGFTTKAGTYLVTVKATLKGKTVTHRVALKVDGLPGWAKGTFNGYIAGVDGATNGLATITVSSVGKISGKFYEGGTNWTFTAASYTGYDSAAPAYSVPVVAKYAYKATEIVKGKKKTVTKSVARNFTLRVGQDALGGVATLEEVGGGSTVNAWQNLWGQADYKALGKRLFSTKSGKKTLAYRTFTIKGTDDVGAEMGLTDAMSLSLKVTTAGAVTATMSFDTGKTSKGKAVIYKPTCSTVVIPLSAADNEEFEGEAILFFAPSSANGFPGFAGAAPF